MKIILCTNKNFEDNENDDENNNEIRLIKKHRFYSGLSNNKNNILKLCLQHTFDVNKHNCSGCLSIDRTNLELINELLKLEKLRYFFIEEIDDKYSHSDFWRIDPGKNAWYCMNPTNYGYYPVDGVTESLVINSGAIIISNLLVEFEKMKFNYQEWLEDVEKGNMITLNFPFNKLLVSKRAIFRKSEVIRTFLEIDEKIEYPIPINYSMVEIENFKNFLLGNVKNSKIAEYLLIV